MGSRRLLLLFGLVALLGVAGLAAGVDVKFPKRARAGVAAIVDELGNTLFGSTPGRVEVTNFPAGSHAAREVVVDADGVAVGEAFHDAGAVYATGTSPSGVQYAIPVTTLALGISSGDVYYPAPNCTGEFYPSVSDLVGFYVRVTHGNSGIAYVPREVGTQRPISNGSVRRWTGECASPWSGNSSLVVASFDTIDVSHLKPPFRLAAQ